MHTQPAPIIRSQWLHAKTEIVTANGMVVARSELAARAGAEVMRAGGNAVDGGVAAAFALGVTEPWNSGLGGNGILMVRKAGSGEVAAVNHYCGAPQKADYRDFLGHTEDLIDGPRACLVPGMLAGVCLALTRYGRLPLAKVLEPAIRLAEEGFPATLGVIKAETTAMNALQKSPLASRTFLPGGYPHGCGGRQLVSPGEKSPSPVVVQPDLGQALRLIASEGPSTFYRGALGRRLVDGLQALGGIMTMADLQAVEARLEEPNHIRYGGYDIYTPSGKFGGGILAEMLLLADRFGLGRPGLDPVTRAHLIVEIQKLAVADYWQHVSDYRPLTVLPEKTILDPAYLAGRAGLISTNRVADIRFEQASHKGEKNTSGLCCADGEGNLFAYTNTYSHIFGNGVVIEGVGAVMNNGMRNFSLDPAALNCLKPGHTPSTPMAPVLVLKDGRPVLAGSAPGGMHIPVYLFQVILEVLDRGLTAQPAVNAPRLDASEPHLAIDSHMPETVIKGLESLGHPLEVRQPGLESWGVARPTVITYDAENRMHSGDYPFAEGGAAGY